MADIACKSLFLNSEISQYIFFSSRVTKSSRGWGERSCAGVIKYLLIHKRKRPRPSDVELKKKHVLSVACALILFFFCVLVERGNEIFQGNRFNFLILVTSSSTLMNGDLVHNFYHHPSLFPLSLIYFDINLKIYSNLLSNHQRFLILALNQI